VAREIFGDVVKPSITVGSQQWYTVPLSIIVHTAIIGASHHHSTDGGRRAADAARR
jgi:hypothetical protein